MPAASPAGSAAFPDPRRWRSEPARLRRVRPPGSTPGRVPRCPSVSSPPARTPPGVLCAVASASGGTSAPRSPAHGRTPGLSARWLAAPRSDRSTVLRPLLTLSPLHCAGPGECQGRAVHKPLTILSPPPRSAAATSSAPPSAPALAQNAIGKTTTPVPHPTRMVDPAK